MTDPVPSIIVPQSETSHLRPKSSRSAIKSFFSRRPSPAPEDRRIQHAVEPGPQTQQSHDQDDGNHLTLRRKPSLGARSCSDNAIPRRSLARSPSRSRRSRSSSVAAIDPPPLFQAYPQALLNATLRVPKKHSSQSYAVEDGIHQAQQPSVLKEKLFFVCKNRLVLRYKTEGTSDRLPEKMFELTSDSVAIASDSVPGHHWVLELRTLEAQDGLRRHSTSHNSWPRLSFRHGAAKRIADRLLMVFDDPDTMSCWLTAIRKEIELLGSDQYAPEPPLPELPPLPQPPLRRTASDYFPTEADVSEQQLAAPSEVTSTNGDKHLKGETAAMKDNTVPSSQRSIASRSLTASSVTTTTSLDRLRESDTGSVVTGATNSLDGSVVLDSPIREQFAGITSSPYKRGSADQSGARHSSSTTWSGPDNRRSGAAAVRPAVPTSLLSSPSSRDQTASTTPMQSEGVVNTAKANDGINLAITERLSAKLPPLPELSSNGLVKDTSHTSSNPAKATQGSEAKGPAGSHSIMASSSVRTSKSGYSLFPKPPEMETKVEAALSSEEIQLPGVIITPASNHVAGFSSSSNSSTPTLTTSMTKVKETKKPLPIKLLAISKVEQAQRSPAVTDSMLATNFGTLMMQPIPSPGTPPTSNVPNFDDMKIEMGIFEKSLATNARSRSRSPPSSQSSRNITPTRSTPNLRLSASMGLAPAGPPPTVPLPKLPKDGDMPIVSRSDSRAELDSQRASRRASSRSRQVAISPVKGPPSSFTRHDTKSPSNVLVPPNPLSFNDFDAHSQTEQSPPSHTGSTCGVPSVVPFPKRSSSRAVPMGEAGVMSTRRKKSVEAHRRAKSSVGKAPTFTTSPPSGISFGCDQSVLAYSLADLEEQRKGCLNLAKC